MNKCKLCGSCAEGYAGRIQGGMEMTSEAGWQAQSNEQQEWDYDHDLHTAWCNVAMGLATDYAEAYCNHQCDDSQDHLAELGRARRELRQHLFNQPASMGPMPIPSELAEVAK